MPLVPKLQEYIDSIEAPNCEPNQENVREAVASMTTAFMTECDMSVASVDDEVISGDYRVPVRIYIPNKNASLPVALFMHGGGHVAGSVSVYDGIARKLAKKINHIVVSIEYRLAPEFKYPIGLNDCKSVTANIFSVLDKQNINYASKNLTLIGDSSGGAICATITADEDFVKTHKITAQVLIYPSLDYTEALLDTDKFGKAGGLLIDAVKFYFSNYFTNNEERKAASPLYGKFYANMPTTFIITAEFDPLSVEAKAYCDKLQEQNVESEFTQIDGVTHSFLMLENLCKKECEQTYNAISEFLNRY